ncbi:MAG: hypothetical protein M3N93_10015 [Acidobacteriota bacterium]|nr:hypothetical protein [Acidobacteriota bacterium]
MAKKKNSAAVELGKRGAKARMTKLSPEERSAVAKKAAVDRWKTAKKKPAARPKNSKDKPEAAAD